MSERVEASFEQSLERIRALVSELESGELSLEQSIQSHRECSALIEHARRLIADAELRVRVLSESPESNDAE